MLNQEVKNYINKSVLCWLATCDTNLIPNVSPKEVFTYFENNTIIIADIASPNTITNIKINSNVCVSFIEIFVQIGFKINGKANIITRENSKFNVYYDKLINL